MKPHLLAPLRDHEEVIAVIRTDLRAFWKRWVFGAIWLLIPFFLFFPLLTVGWVGIGIFLAAELSAWIFLIKEWTIWRYTMLIITNERLIDVEQHRFFDRHVHSIELADIASMQTAYLGPVQKIMGIGCILIDGPANHPFSIEFCGMRRPEILQELIDDVQCLQGRRDLHKRDSYGQSKKARTTK